MEDERIKKVQQMQIEGILNTPNTKYTKFEEDLAYKNHAKQIISRDGLDQAVNRMDTEIAGLMLKEGYHQNTVARAIREYSPNRNIVELSLRDDSWSERLVDDSLDIVRKANKLNKLETNTEILNDNQIELSANMQKETNKNLEISFQESIHTYQEDISFQKPGGPFRVEGISSSSWDTQYDSVRFVVYKNDQVFEESYSYSAYQDNANASTLQLVAKELQKNHPEFFDQEAYYKSSSLYKREVPLPLIKQQVESDISIIQAQLERDRQTCREYSISQLDLYNMQRNRSAISHQDMEKALTEKHFLKDEYLELKSLKSHQQLYKSYQRELEKYFETTPKPAWYQFSAKKEYKEVKQRLEAVNKDIQENENVLNEQKKLIEERTDQLSNEINSAINRVRDAANNIDFIEQYSPPLYGLRHDIQQLERYSSVKDVTIPITGSYQKFDNEQIDAIGKTLKTKIEAGYKKHLEQTLDPAELRTMPFQGPGGPFTYHNSTFFLDNGREYDRNIILENGKIVQTIERPDLSEYGAYLETAQYMSDRLLKDYPQHFSLEGYNKERADMPELAKIDSHDIQLPFQRERGPVNAIRFYGIRDDGIVNDIIEVRVNGEFAKQFTGEIFPDAPRDHPDVRGNLGAYPEVVNYIAKELAEKYPAYFNKAGYETDYKEMYESIPKGLPLGYSDHPLQYTPQELGKIQDSNLKLSQEKEYSMRLQKIQEFAPDKRLQRTHSQEYLKQAKILHEKNYPVDKRDEVIAKSMLAKGIGKNAVIRAIAKHSPQYTAREGQMAVRKLVKEIAQSPEIKRAQQRSLAISR